MDRIEILAPSGSMESVVAAVRSGADAVYLGAEQFSARASAKNFSMEELKQTVQYCHIRGVKVYLTMNTLITDEEINTALELAKEACLLPIDAFIVQDVGFAGILRKAVPNIPLHGSTQMSVHTPRGAKLLYDLGFKRVVLSRELSKKEIIEIRKICPIELEVFVHGALCMCVSGQCYLSAMLGGRSGNRGQCAQPCRLPFMVEGGTGHDLSLKDLSILDFIGELEKIGVTSAKIEGRMKRPEYVACAVKAAKESLDKGYVPADTMQYLRSVFSRSGFTDGYFTGKTGKNMFGTRQKEDVTSATAKTLAQIKNNYRNEGQSVAVEFNLTIKNNSPVILTATDIDNNQRTVKGNNPEKAINVPLSIEKATAQLSKTGGTPFYVQGVYCDIDQGLTVPMGELNSLRRLVLEKLAAQRSMKKPYEINEDVKIHRKVYYRQEQPTIRCVFPDTNIPSEFKECEYIYVPFNSSQSELCRLIKAGFNVALDLPRGMFGSENIIEQYILKAKEVGVDTVLASNIGSIAVAQKCGVQINGGFGLNVFNTESLNFYEALGLKSADVSFELTFNKINELGEIGRAHV